MKKTLTIAGLALRSAVRSRLLGALVIVLLLVLVALPLTVEGDGTLSGQVRVLIFYTLGVCLIILSAATLWVSSAAVSQDIENRQIRLIAVKPVHAAHIWLGKWLAVLGLNAVLLVLIGACTWLSVQYVLARSDDAEAVMSVRRGLLAARQKVEPRPPYSDQQIERILKAYEAGGNISGDLSRRELKESLRQRLMSEYLSVEPGASRQWIFDLPATSLSAIKAAVKKDRHSLHYVQVQFRLVSRLRDEDAVKGRWIVRLRGAQESAKDNRNGVSLVHPDEWAPDGVYTIPVPADLTGVMVSDVKAPKICLVATFFNDGAEDSHSAIFDPKRPATLLIAEGGFAGNLVRALAVIFCGLALLAALGVSCGSVFSFPVATFAAVSVMVIVSMSQFFSFEGAETAFVHPQRHHREPAAKPSAFVKGSQVVLHGMEKLIEPLAEFQPVASVAEGSLISPAMVWRAFLTMVIVYSGVIGAAGIAALRRRELALPV